jgi:hypothetical protein
MCCTETIEEENLVKGFTDALYNVVWVWLPCLMTYFHKQT